MGQPETTKCVLKLRLGASLTGPTKRMARDLHQASLLYNQCRNAIVRAWERSAEDNPSETFAMFVCRCGAAERRASRKAAGESKVREHCTCEDNPCEVARQACPLLAAKITTSCATQEVSAKLRSKLPWNRPNKAHRYIWQGILANQVARPCYRGSELPVPCQDAKLSLTDSGYTLSFPVWSLASGRQHRNFLCRIPTKRLTRGYKRILFNIVKGEWNLCDSRLQFHEPRSRQKKGFWAIHLVYDRKQDPIAGLDSKQVARLTLQPKDAKKPFDVSTDGVFKPWLLGDVDVYLGFLSRLETRRLEMRLRHKEKGSGRRGHGRGRTEKAIRPATRKARNIARLFQWRIVAQLVRFCERYGCGVVEFSEPKQGQKNASWFAVPGRPWTWADFMSRLKHKLWVNGIDLRESEGGEQKQARRSRGPKVNGGTGNGKMPHNGGEVANGKNGVARKTGRKAGRGRDEK